MSVIEIAKLAGVSVATVSRVINQNPSVTSDTSAKVRSVMDKIGYRPIARAKDTSVQSNGLVALIATSPHIFDPYSSTGHIAIKGAQEALSSRNIGMLLVYDDTDNAELPDYLFDGRVKGFIVFGHNPSQTFIDKIEKYPTVWMHSRHQSTGDVVLQGNETVGQLAAEYLVKRGHKHIGVLNTLAEVAGDSRVRFFKFIASEMNCKVSVFSYKEPSNKIWGQSLDLEWFEASVTELVDQMLSKADRPTGLFVPSDFQVAILYRVLAKKGIRPGFDIEIIGSDEEKGALMGLYPRPATISIGAESMGKRAVDCLIMKINNELSDRMQVFIEPNIIEGDVIDKTFH